MAKKPPKPPRRQPPADDDAALWQAVTGDVAPLKRRGEPPAPSTLPPGAPPEHSQEPAKAPPVASRKGRKPAPRTAPPAPPEPVEMPEIAPGRSAGLDKRTAQKLRRGRLAVEAQIDLHGMTQAEARPRLDDFLEASQERGLRCVRVITGIGRVRDEGGVLRAAVPRWLNQAPNRARILAFELAQPKDGGHGALYVLLKKRRGE